MVLKRKIHGSNFLLQLGKCLRIASWLFLPMKVLSLSLPLCTIVCAPECMMWLYDQSWTVFLKCRLPFSSLSLETGSFTDPEITNWPLLGRSMSSKDPLTPNSPACYTWPYMGSGNRTKVLTFARQALYYLACLPAMFFFLFFLVFSFIFSPGSFIEFCKVWGNKCVLFGSKTVFFKAINENGSNCFHTRLSLSLRCGS